MGKENNYIANKKVLFNLVSNPKKAGENHIQILDISW